MTYLAILLITLVVAGFTYEQISRQIVKYKYPVQGQLVDVGGGRKIQIDCRGTQNSNLPTVVFESGGDDLGSLSWAKVQDEIAKTTQACSYSRAGILWSDRDSRPYTIDNITSDLHIALTKIGVTGLLVLVGQSIGGPINMRYTKQFGDQVKGLVFVDTSHPEQLRKMREINKSLGIEDKPLLSPQVVWLLNLASNFGVNRLFGSSVSLLPPEQAKIASAYAPQSLDKVLEALIGGPQEQVIIDSGDFHNLGDRPLVVLNSTKIEQLSDTELLISGLTKELYEKQQTKNKELWTSQAKDQASWSTNSKLIYTDKSGHFLHLEEPELVIKSINEVLEAVKTGNKLNK
jgi:pimeloyl-ACP methyl ester carboxylesterase